jgi:hypothetical protein
MSDQGQPRPRGSHDGFRLLALVAVSVGLLLLAAAAFVLSYAGVHDVALSAGVSQRLARLYPLIFDAMLVVACAAVLSLRGAGLPSRCYAWLSLLVLLTVVAFADALHATNAALPHRPAAAAVAVIPWALVLIGFGLLLTMLRHTRLRRAALAAPERPVRRGGLSALGFAPAQPPPLPAGFGAGSAPGPDHGDGPVFQHYPESEPGFDVRADGETGLDAADEAETDLDAAGDAEALAGYGDEPDALPESHDEPGHGAQPEPGTAPGPGEAQDFERVRSFPVPPEA